MAEMSVIWLRVAAALYSLGLLHSILTLTQRRDNLFRYALGAARAGVLLHLVSVIEEGLITGRCPIANFYETLSMCALIVMSLFLVVHWRYKIESLQRVHLPAGLRDDAGRHHGTAGGGMVQPGGSQRVADDAYCAGAAGLCGAAAHRGSVGAST